MAGINHLREIHEKKGEEFLHNLLNNFVIINEKVDGTAFGLKKNKSDDSFKYFKKSGEISYIDRVLMKYYTPAIKYFESIPLEKRQRIPSNFYFGFEYLSSSDNNSSRYQSLPKNNLVLTYIHRLDEKGRPIETLQTKEDLDKWADYLGVERPPIVFEGMLSSEQKTSILDFVYSPEKELAEKFKTTSFTKYILSVLNPEQKSSFLNKDLNANIDTLVFRFYDENEENPSAKVFLAKLVDPLFYQRISENEPTKENKSQDYIWLIVIDLMNHIEMYGVKELQDTVKIGNTYDEKYVNLMNKVFKDFLRNYKQKYEGLQLDVPEYLKRPEFEIDENMIGDAEVISIISNNETYKEIYRILINFFRKVRKKSSSSFFTNDLLNQLNIQVKKIKSIIMGDNVYESLIPTFGEFVGDTSEDYLIEHDDFDKREKLDDPIKVNILIGSFQPIHLGHIKAAKKLKEQNGLPCFLISIKNKQTPLSPFTVRSTQVMLEKIQQEYPELIVNVKVINNSNIEDALKEIFPEYAPALWGTSESRIKDYALQLEYIKRKSIPLRLSTDFKLVQLPVYLDSKTVIESIKTGNFVEFKKLVPSSIISEFFNLQQELENFGMKVSESKVNESESGDSPDNNSETDLN